MSGVLDLSGARIVRDEHGTLHVSGVFNRDDLMPRREAGLHWTAYTWAWLRLEVER